MSGLGAIVEATDGSGPLLKLAEARAQALLGAESPSFSLLCLPPDKGSEDALFARLPRFDAVYTCGVLQHLSDHELYEGACFMERAVTDKGTLIVVVPLDHKGDPDRKTFLRDSLDYATLFGKLFKSPLLFCAPRAFIYYTGQISVQTIVQGTFEELPSSAWAFGWPRRKSGTASALPVTSADERPAFFFATRKAS